MIWINNVLRYLKFLDRSTKFNLFVLVLSITLFGIFGFIPLTISAYQKIKLLGEMSSVNQKLIAHEKKDIEIKNEMIEIRSYTKYLDIFFPQGRNVEDFITQLQIPVLVNGYFLRNVTSNEKDQNTTNISFNTNGYGDVLSLVKGIEGLKRANKINSLTLYKVRGDVMVNINLDIYSR